MLGRVLLGFPELPAVGDPQVHRDLLVIMDPSDQKAQRSVGTSL